MAGLAVVAALVTFVLLVLCRVPVAFSLLVAGASGLILQEGPRTAGAVLSGQPFQSVFNYSLLVVPLFIAMGVYVREAGVAQAIYKFLSRVLGKLPGGLAVATVFAGAGFAAVSGSSTATAATLGKIGIQEMLSHGYKKSNAAGVVAAAGTLGILIPPSIALVLYGMITGESIGMLLLAGILPGILSAVMLAATAVVVEARHGRHRPALVGVEPAGTGFLGRPSNGEEQPRWNSEDAVRPGQQMGGIAAVGIIAALFLVTMGGIYLGVMTVTESAAMAAVLALGVYVTVLIRWHRTSMWLKLSNTVRETVTLTTMIFAIFIGAGVFNYLLVSGGIPQSVSAVVSNLNVPPLVVVGLFLLLLVPLGMFLDGTAMMLIVAPLAHPIVVELGYSGIWFAILFVIMVEFGLLTPPVGLNAYVVAGVTDGLSVGTVFRGVGPYLLAQVAVIGVLFIFPEIVTWLPSSQS